MSVQLTVRVTGLAEESRSGAGRCEKIEMMYAGTMKAAVLRGKEDLRMERVPMPQAGPGELVVRVDAALTCGTDLKVYPAGISRDDADRGQALRA